MRKLVILVAALAVAFFGYIVYRDVAASPIVVVKETVMTTAPSGTTTESVPTETTKAKKKKAKAAEPTTEATEPEDDYFPFPDEPIYTIEPPEFGEEPITTIEPPELGEEPIYTIEPPELEEAPDEKIIAEIDPDDGITGEPAFAEPEETALI